MPITLSSPNTSPADAIHLLPRPRSLELTGGIVDPAALAIHECRDPAVAAESGPEAYRLEAGARGIFIRAASDTGLRWARATLAQLRAHDTIPCMVIEDAPRFAHRGVMLDISRDRVPTMATLCGLVDRLAAWKMNHLQLYVEHTIAYAGHEDVWRAASPITLDELSALDAYAAARGVALTANQNCLGHFERWLRHPRYAPLGECAQGHLVRGEHYVPPNTLCPLDPRTLPLIEDLLEQQLPRCSGAYANIGCDEPWDLGMGRSREACAQHGKATVFSEHVRRVAEIALRLGKRPQFWCDPEPNEGDNLPRDLVALVWQYEAGEDFGPRVRAHLNAGREAWVAPGTSCWNTTTGRTWNRRGNLDHAAAQTQAAGLLCTAWGDAGHRQPWPITLFGFADAAMAAWSGPGRFSDAANGRFAFGNPDMGRWLARLGNVDESLCRGSCPNGSPLWRDLHGHFFEPPGGADLAQWEEVRQRLLDLRAALPGAPSSCSDPLITEECRLAADFALYAADRAILRRRDPQPHGRKELAARMAHLIAAHRRQWLCRSRYGGLEDSTAHWARFASHW
jgi:hypothetical protein